MNKTKEVAVQEDRNLVTESKVLEWLDMTGVTSKLNDNEKKMFIEVAVSLQLNPLKKEVYVVPYNGKGGRNLSIITAYQVYLKRADMIGTLDGWECHHEGTRAEQNLKAVVTINRKDWDKPFVHEAYWFEYYQNNRFWNTKPITMIKKVAISQAFRMCFPVEFSGMPYTADELPDEQTVMRDVTPEVQSQPVNQPVAQEEVPAQEKTTIAEDGLNMNAPDPFEEQAIQDYNEKTPEPKVNGGGMKGFGSSSFGAGMTDKEVEETIF